MYRYLFTDDEGAVLARVSYHFTPLTPASRNGPAEGDELIVDECIPPGFEIDRPEELALRLNAALLDRDEADSRDADPDLIDEVEHTYGESIQRRLVRHKVGG